MSNQYVHPESVNHTGSTHGVRLSRHPFPLTSILIHYHVGLHWLMRSVCPNKRIAFAYPDDGQFRVSMQPHPSIT